MKNNIELPKVNNELICEYLNKWNQLEKYVNQERALNKLYIDLMPTNNVLSDILIKCSCLNDFYSTNIFDIHSMGEHIYNNVRDIDIRLKNKDYSVVNEVALVTIGGKKKNNYSFATKYCSHHYPEDYPIYDSYVAKVLMYYKKTDNFSNFKRDDLKDYKEFIRVLNDFQQFYNITSFTLKEIDKYLWQMGKEKYPNNFKVK